MTDLCSTALGREGRGSRLQLTYFGHTIFECELSPTNPTEARHRIATDMPGGKNQTERELRRDKEKERTGKESTKVTVPNNTVHVQYKHTTKPWVLHIYTQTIMDANSHVSNVTAIWLPEPIYEHNNLRRYYGKHTEHDTAKFHLYPLPLKHRIPITVPLALVLEVGQRSSSQLPRDGKSPHSLCVDDTARATENEGTHRAASHRWRMVHVIRTYHPTFPDFSRSGQCTYSVYQVCNIISRT